MLREWALYIINYESIKDLGRYLFQATVLLPMAKKYGFNNESLVL